MSATLFAIAMPKWGLEMAEGTISAWRVQEGDTVNSNDELVDIETSKIVNTLTCSQPGTLVRIVGREGAVLDVGSLLGVIATAETSAEDIDRFIASCTQDTTVDVIDAAANAQQPEPPHSTTHSTTHSATHSTTQRQAIAPVRSTATSTATPSSAAPQNETIVIPASLSRGDDDSTVAATPVARRLASEHTINLNNLSGTGRHGRVTRSDLKTAVVAAGGCFNLPAAKTGSAASASKGDDSNVTATPVARRLAKQWGINLLDCRSTGRNHRVSKADVETTAARFNMLGSDGNQHAATHLATTDAEVTAQNSQQLTGMRRTIADRLQASKREAPHFRACTDVELDQLLALRKQLNHSRDDANISINDCLIKATAMALAEVPAVNIQFDGNNVTHMPHADIAVAVALDDGLITPIVSAAESKGLVAISNTMRDLSTRARLGKLKPDEFQGGSFSLSNLGMFGIKQFDAIINPPQAAILAVGAGATQLLPADNNSVRHATVMTLTLSSDHRVIDGAVAAHFLQVLKRFIEQPATMLG